MENSQKTAIRNGMNNRRLHLSLYDAVLLLIVDFLILVVYPSHKDKLPLLDLLVHIVLFAACIYFFRALFKVYNQVWRYGTPIAYVRLIMADILAGITYFVAQTLLPIRGVEFIRAVSMFSIDLLLAITIRVFYHMFYERLNRSVNTSGFLWRMFILFSGLDSEKETVRDSGLIKNKINIAIVGAGRVGSMLAEELLNNPRSLYRPCCFVDIDRLKIGRQVYGIPVLSDEEASTKGLEKYGVQEIVFALPQMSAERKQEIFEYYKETGCRIKVYDYPTMLKADNSKRHMRDFDADELLFRTSVELHSEATEAYYKNKVVLITGGGGSIGSELARQIAAMGPRTLVILDIYENGAYELQQELIMTYGKDFDIRIEIASVCDSVALEKVFAKYRPDIVLHAAAHKHVPLMENNVCEAVKNNVFGTLSTVKAAEKNKVGRFIMISTDKAVNPTNVMGATKRMCEMIVQAHSLSGSGTVFSATRFGNVLGSAGSVIPLFKKQIMRGGPVTVTDKRIIRYFMTIPEASRLVLQSGEMAKNGELFVLDMGKPVKIYDFAENLIRLSGYEPHKDIEIIETGLRPGEKLYEELLIKTEELDKTENSKIFIERDNPITLDELNKKLDGLKKALETEDDAQVKIALKKAVPTFRDPGEVNSAAEATKILA